MDRVQMSENEMSQDIRAWRPPVVAQAASTARNTITWVCWTLMAGSRRNEVVRDREMSKVFEMMASVHFRSVVSVLQLKLSVLSLVLQECQEQNHQLTRRRARTHRTHDPVLLFCKVLIEPYHTTRWRPSREDSRRSNEGWVLG